MDMGIDSSEGDLSAREELMREQQAGRPGQIRRFRESPSFLNLFESVRLFVQLCYSQHQVSNLYGSERKETDRVRETENG